MGRLAATVMLVLSLMAIAQGRPDKSSFFLEGRFRFITQIQYAHAVMHRKCDKTSFNNYILIYFKCVYDGANVTDRINLHTLE